MELENSRLMTQSVARTSSPVWNKQFRLMVGDINSCLGLTVLERDRGMKTNLLGKLSLPLLSLVNVPGSSKSFLLKDKQLRLAARGNRPELELEWRLDWDRLKAALVSLTPRQEIVMNRSEKFKRRLLTDNIARVKSLVSQAERTVETVSRNIHWEDRLWVLRAYLAFLVIAFTFQLYMVPLLLAGLLLASFYKTNHIDVIVEKEVVSENSEELEEMMEKEKDENVSLNKILTLVQDAFPLIQNCLGLVASSAEKLKNTFNWSVPFLTLIALISLLVISVILFLVDLRTLVIILGSVKFIKNLILPGWESNNELLDFLSRVPDDRLLQETKEISR